MTNELTGASASRQGEQEMWDVSQPEPESDANDSGQGEPFAWKVDGDLDIRGLDKLLARLEVVAFLLIVIGTLVTVDVFGTIILLLNAD